MYARETLWRAEHGLGLDPRHNDHIPKYNMLTYSKQRKEFVGLRYSTASGWTFSQQF